MTNRLDRVLHDFASTQGIPEGTAFLGNNAGKIVPDDELARSRRQVYIHYNNGVVGLAVLAEWVKIPYRDIAEVANFNLPVDLERIRGVLYVVATGVKGIAALGGEVIAEKIESATQFPAAEQISTLRVTAAIPVGMLVWIHGPAIVKSPVDDSRWYIDPQAKVDLSAQIGALTSGQHQLACICYDADAGQFVVVTGTAVAGGTLPSRNTFNIEHVRALPLWEYVPLVCVYLYYGQTAIEEADFYRGFPMRPFVAADTKFHLIPTAATSNLQNGSFHATQAFHRVSSETGYTDDLSYITPALTGQLMIVQAETGHTITVKHGVANIFLNGGADFELTQNKSLMLAHDGDNWSDIGAGGGAPGGGLTVEEQDESPTVEATTLKFDNGTVVDEGDGIVSVYFPSMATWTVAGSLTASKAPFRFYNCFGGARTITKVKLWCETAPTGAAIIVDIHKNGTTIFTTQSNRPQIAATANEGDSTTIEVPSWADGEYLEMYVDQIGSTIPGSYLVVHVAYR